MAYDMIQHGTCLSDMKFDALFWNAMLLFESRCFYVIYPVRYNSLIYLHCMILFVPGSFAFWHC